MKTFETKKAPAAIGPYSQAKMAGNFVFASGQIPVDPATGEVAGDKIEKMCIRDRFCDGRGRTGTSGGESAASLCTYPFLHGRK